MVIRPRPAFHFQVGWGGDEVGFAEVSGLTAGNQAVEYRDGAIPGCSAVKMPGMPRYGNVSLKRGIIPADNDFIDWLNSTRLNQVERRELTVSLLNEKQEPVMSWTILGAFPVKIEGPELKAIAGEVAIESIELAHEGIIIRNG